VKNENWIGAANDYLESFTINPNGESAAKTLFGLGVSLGAIGDKDQACLTLDEVRSRFKNIEKTLLAEIVKAKNLLNCDQPR
jgi:TolA-binding protein